MNARAMLRASRLCARCSYSTGTGTTSTSTSTTTTPPLLLKIRQDMKAAMVAKDSARLAVLRALLSQSLNASKTARPIRSDAQVLALLRKSTAAARAAAAEFAQNGRPDLAGKEEAQAAVMEEYTRAVPRMPDDELRAVVRRVLDELKGDGEVKDLRQGEVLKRLFAPDVLGEKHVDKNDVARLVRQCMMASQG